MVARPATSVNARAALAPGGAAVGDGGRVDAAGPGAAGAGGRVALLQALRALAAPGTP